MSKIRDPREKKRLRYSRDRVSGAEYPHAARRHVPQKKALYHRALRSKTRQALREVARASDSGDSFAPPDPRLLGGLYPWSHTVALGDAVQGALQWRVGWTGSNYFKKPYKSSVHREPFAQFLRSLVQGQSGRAVDLAKRFRVVLEFCEDTKLVAAVRALQQWEGALRDASGTPAFRELLESRPVADSSIPQSGVEAAWLASFFEDEPQWKQRLRDWTASVAPETR
jgi:hypothetical protein